MKDLKQTYTLHYHLREPYPHKEDIVCTLKWSDRRSYGISIEATAKCGCISTFGKRKGCSPNGRRKRGWIIEKVLMQRQRLEEAQKKGGAKRQMLHAGAEKRTGKTLQRSGKRVFSQKSCVLCLSSGRFL